MGAIETVLVTMIVAGAAVYAAWSLLPASVRLRGLAAFVKLLDSGVPLPRTMRERLRHAAVTRASRTSGCGQCGGQPRRPLKSRQDGRLRRTR
jgi:alkylhydroperoxidase family enzyme